MVFQNDEPISFLALKNKVETKTILFKSITDSIIWLSWALLFYIWIELILDKNKTEESCANECEWKKIMNELC